MECKILKIRILRNIITLILVFCFVGCNTTTKKDDAKNKTQKSVAQSAENNASTILNMALKAHGGMLYKNAHYQFVFREKQYSFNNQKGYVYTVLAKDSVGNFVLDSLANGTFKRYINGVQTMLLPNEKAKYAAALNSVIYFATLPHKLSDKSVVASYLGEAIIEEEVYKLIKVSFLKNGGGVDYDDVFCYWIHKNTNFIKYLAYSYKTNNGGVRFRKAYHTRNVDGIRFQDYINYEAPVGTALKKLPELYEKGTLKELSRIETTMVKNLNPSRVEH